MKKLLEKIINQNDTSLVSSSEIYQKILEESNGKIEDFVFRISSYIQRENFSDYQTCYKFLRQDIQYIKGVGPKRALAFKSRVIWDVEDILKFIPINYRDFSNISTVKNCSINSNVTLKLKFRTYKLIKFRKRKILEAEFFDNTSTIYLKWFNFNLNHLKKFFDSNKEYIVYGKVSIFNFQKEIIHPIIKEFSDFTDAIEPVYSNIPNASNKIIIEIMRNIFEKLKFFTYEYLPAHILVKRNLPDILQCLHQLHFPDKKNFSKIENFKKRLIYDEFFFTMLAVVKEKLKKDSIKTEPIIYNGKIVKPFLDKLPFELTKSQRKVLREIFLDLKNGKQLNRLIQGDVGSGKTIVALISALLIIENNAQVAFMAPTEILAEQHYKNIKKFNLPIKMALLVGSTSKKEKLKIKENIENGGIDLVIGTHALIQEDVTFKNLKLNIVDEQHKFGVKQRMFLKEKGFFTHTLIMTATPIPRTLTLTLYGDLDVSVIDELPPNRRPIKTYWFKESQRDMFIEKIKKELEKGRQAYFIYPLVEESDKLDLKSVVKMSEILKNNYFENYSLAVLHGKMKPEEKENIMRNFAQNKIDILVATTVVEVGIDVPNATVMVIEHSERFGLSQLHQLRGRIGRGEHQSYCYLISSNKLSSDAIQRLKIMVGTNDGFKIAEADLKIRGGGELTGVRQSGIAEFQFADIIRDYKVLVDAKNDAEELLSFDFELNNFPCLKNRFQNFFTNKGKFVSTG